MKWQHWLVWALLASWAIGLSACMAPEQKVLVQENKALRKERDSLRVVAAERDSLRRDLLFCKSSRLYDPYADHSEPGVIEYKYAHHVRWARERVPRNPYVIIRCDGNLWTGYLQLQ